MKQRIELIHSPMELNGIDGICGVDEVGRGPAAGPVVAAGVIFPKDFKSSIIMDSKLLSDKKLRVAYKEIKENTIDYSVQATSVKHINANGINASVFNAMHKSIDIISSRTTLNHLLIDGTQWDNYKGINYQTVVKGDNTYLSIAAASIIAKVDRDDYMIKLSEIYPYYDFENNKGYLTAKHQKGILENGVIDYHRIQYVNTWLAKQK